MQNWRVKHTAVGSLSEDVYGILTWAVFTDGCTSTVVLPHIRQCLEIMGIKGEVHAGTMPFFHWVDVSRNTQEAMRAFDELFAERVISGSYCTLEERARLIEHGNPARVALVRSRDESFEVVIKATGPEHIGTFARNSAHCRLVEMEDNRRTITIDVPGVLDTPQLSAKLRLIGNMMHLRWDPRDSYTQQLFGQPLL